MLLMVRRMLAAAEASEPGPIWRSRLNFTSWAVSLSPLWKVWPGRMIEGPGQAVGRQLPLLGDAGADAAFREVEADQRVVHHRLVDRVARPAFEDRIERLGAERFDGEDQGALSGPGREAARWPTAGERASRIDHRQMTHQRRDRLRCGSSAARTHTRPALSHRPRRSTLVCVLALVPCSRSLSRGRHSSGRSFAALQQKTVQYSTCRQSAAAVRTPPACTCKATRIAISPFLRRSGPRALPRLPIVTL